MNYLRRLCVCACLYTILTCGYTVAVSTDTGTNVTCNSTLICETNGKKDKQVLYILAMGPYPYPTDDKKNTPSWPGGPAVIPAVLLAAQHINCDPDVLPDYRLEVIISDDGCQLKTRAFANLTSNVYFNQSSTGDVVGIIGGGCSESALVIAQHVTRDPLSLIQIAPSATSPEFVNEIHLYRNTLRLAPSAYSFISVFTHIVLNNSYSEVAILYDFERRYMLEVATAFREVLNESNVTVSAHEAIFNHFVEESLEKLRGHNRLIFVFAGRDLADEVLCMAYIKGMLYPVYQFIFINRRANNFMKDVNFTNPATGKLVANCSEEQMTEAVRSVTIFEPRLTRSDQNTPTVSGYTFEEIECQYQEVFDNHKKSLQLEEEVIDTEYQNAYYDSTWALAKSLHNAQPEVDLSSYRYGQPDNTKVILDEFFNLSFQGAVGKIAFSRTTFDTQGVSIVNIYQQRLNETSSKTDSIVVAFYSPEIGRVNSSSIAKFVNSSVFDKRLAILHPPLELGWAVVALTIVMFIVIGLLHCTNWTFADVKNLKATSPHLNNIIFSGCYLLLLGVLTYSMISVFLVEESSPDPPDRIWFSVLCNVQLWVSTYAVSLIFGTICIKTWRIWRIFTHFSSSPLKFAGDGILIGFIVSLIAIDTVYLTVWISVNPLQMTLIRMETTEIAICGSSNSTLTTAWVIVLALYKVLVIGLVLFLSLKTRKISKKEFKQTKSINTLIYIQLFVLTLGIAPYAIVTESRKLDEGSMVAAYVLHCVAYILATVFCVIFVFLPPIYPLIRKKLHYYYHS